MKCRFIPVSIRRAVITVWIAVAISFVVGLMHVMYSEGVFPVAGGMCVAGALVAASVMVLAESLSNKPPSS